MITEEQAAAILKELEMLRKLKVIEFMERGYSQDQLAEIFGVSQPTVSRMVPKVRRKKTRHES